MDSYRHDMKQAKLKHATACVEQCDCGLSLLERPESRNFIAGNARKFKWLLSDVLLEVSQLMSERIIKTACLRSLTNRGLLCAYKSRDLLLVTPFGF